MPYNREALYLDYFLLQYLVHPPQDIMDPDEVVQRGQSEVGGSVAQVSVHVTDAYELLQLLSLLAAAHVVQQASDIVQRGIGEDLLMHNFEF